MDDKSSTPQIILRPMTLADLDQVLAIERVSFPTPWPIDAYLFELRHNRHSICWVAEGLDPVDGPSVVGSIVIWVHKGQAHVATLAVHPDFRQRGIAQSLLAKALQESIAMGAKSALLEVREQNKKAQQLYLKFGFLVVGRRTGYYQDTQEDAVLMALPILEKEKLADLGNHG